jgi:uncharacterized protein YcgL (UPF0745 family)
MLAFVYKSLKKADTYLYLVLEVGLTPERRLARENPDVVRSNLTSRGFHLQFPPTVIDPMSDDWGTDA